MNKSQVEIFMLMVREGSIHIASQRLGIVPSLITTSVCALENELGFNLIRAEEYQKSYSNGERARFLPACSRITEITQCDCGYSRGNKTARRVFTAGQNNQFSPRKYWAILK